MILYAESSAVLGWLLAEPSGRSVADCLSRAEHVISSELTLVECQRVLLRATHLQEASEGEAAAMRFRLSRAAGHWTLLGLGEEVLARAGSAFPVEPVRTLDALHVASALVASSVLGELTVLSLDRRIRECAHALGLELLPA